MNVLLLLLLLVAGEGVYFEHTQRLQIDAGIQIQLTQWQSVVNSLDAENKDLADTRNGILKQTTALESGIEKSNADLARTQALLTAAEKQHEAEEAQKASAGRIDPSLGTITTTDGRTFQNCQLLKIEADGITFNHADGITKVMFPKLPAALQKTFGYDPQADSARQAAQARYEEQSREAGGGGASQTAAQ